MTMTTPSNNSKRHSLAISTSATSPTTGPRPLHLLDGNIPTTAPLAPSSWGTSPYSPTLSSAPLSSTPLSSTRARHPSRRQSSISYFPRDGQLKSPLSGGRSPGASLARSNSLGLGSRAGTRAPPDRKSTGSILEPQAQKEKEKEKERPPLTLTEKHADLLHFIAQKESKCLELRSQLAVHEAELLQLKRKWERIVNRGFERDNASGPSSLSASLASTSTSPPAQTMFGIEGFKEGVQGMSRLIAAAIAEPSRPALSSSASYPSSSASASAYPSPTPTPTPTPFSRRKPTHTPKGSSSTSTSASASASSKSTRFSLTSASSLGEEILDVLLKSDEMDDGADGRESKGGNREKEGREQVLIVRDTGATPTMSPNPEFHTHKRQRELRARQEPSSPSNSPSPSSSSPSLKSLSPSLESRASEDFINIVEEDEDNTITSPTPVSLQGTKALRRRSRGGVPPPEGPPPLDLASPIPPAKEKAITSPPLTGAAARAQSLPGASSIPGFAGGAGAGAGASSWVGSVGKKLGELQRSSTFTNSQKRASLLLSDVSSSFLSALAVSPPQTGTSVSPPPSAFTSFHVSLSSSSSAQTPAKAPSSSSSVSGSRSLLDDDNDALTPASAPILVPLTPAPSRKHVRAPSKSAGVHSPRGSLTRAREKEKPKVVVDEEEEWNW